MTNNYDQLATEQGVDKYIMLEKLVKRNTKIQLCNTCIQIIIFIGVGLIIADLIILEYKAKEEFNEYSGLIDSVPGVVQRLDNFLDTICDEYGVC